MSLKYCKLNQPLNKLNSFGILKYLCVIMKSFLRKLVPSRVKSFINFSPLDFFIKKSFSQEGEDLMLDIMMNYKKNGFYVDVGAHHPFKFSNTFYYYLKGWNGVCIDANPGLSSAFAKYRPRDLFFNTGISRNAGEFEYFCFLDAALNTMDDKLKEKRIKDGHAFKEAIKINTSSLKDVLDLAGLNTTIDFMSIDVEGLELEVLKSNNWEKYSPKFIIVHYKSKNINDCLQSSMSSYLSEKNYEMYAKSFHSVFYKIRI